MPVIHAGHTCQFFLYGLSLHAFWAQDEAVDTAQWSCQVVDLAEMHL